MVTDAQFQTPMPVVEYMVSMIPPGTRTVFEPSPGKGNIVAALMGRGLEVTAAGDFFLFEPRRFDCVVMNPPFSAKSGFMANAPEHLRDAGLGVGYHFLTECMKMSDNVIAILPWFTLVDSDVRMRVLKRFGIRSITHLPRKTFNYTRIQTAVLELEHGYSGETALRVFELMPGSTLATNHQQTAMLV